MRMKMDSKEYITVKQYAEIVGCSEQYVRKQIAKGMFYTIERKNAQNNRKQYMIPVDSLPLEIREQLLATNKKTIKSSVKSSFARGSRRCTTDFPGKNCPSVISVIMPVPPFPEAAEEAAAMPAPRSEPLFPPGIHPRAAWS